MSKGLYLLLNVHLWSSGMKSTDPAIEVTKGFDPVFITMMEKILSNDDVCMY